MQQISIIAGNLIVSVPRNAAPRWRLSTTQFAKRITFQPIIHNRINSVPGTNYSDKINRIVGPSPVPYVSTLSTPTDNYSRESSTLQLARRRRNRFSKMAHIMKYIHGSHHRVQQNSEHSNKLNRVNIESVFCSAGITANDHIIMYTRYQLLR